MLVNEERGFGYKGAKRWFEEQSRDPKVWSVIQSNILGSSIDSDTYREGTGQMGTMKISKRKLLPLH